MRVDVAEHLAGWLEGVESLRRDPRAVDVPEWLVYAAIAEIKLLRAMIRDAQEEPGLLGPIVEMIDGEA